MCKHCSGQRPSKQIGLCSGNNYSELILPQISAITTLEIQREKTLPSKGRDDWHTKRVFFRFEMRPCNMEETLSVRQVKFF